MDIAEFAVIRAPRAPRSGPTLTLAETRTIEVRPDGPGTHVPKAVKLVLRATDLPEGLGPIPDDLLADPPDGADATILQRTLAVFRGLERALAAAGDRMDAEALGSQLVALLKQHRLDDVDWDTLFDRHGLNWTLLPGLALVVLRQRLMQTMTSDEPDYDLAVRLTRLTLVAATVEALTGKHKLTVDQVFELLHHIPVVIPELTADEMCGTPKVQLLREARVSDLQVLRREWVGYLPGEIANVRNIMQGEAFTLSELTVRETETTLENVTERRETTESSTESRQESELTTEVNSQLGVTINGHVEGSAEFRYPVVTARVSAGVDAGLSLQRSERQASKIAREAVARATSRVDATTRESRVRRELSRTEQGMNYSLRNTDDGNLHGIYRWVDRVDGYQLFRYTDRLLLEFQIPEPAEFYRWRIDRTRERAAAVDAPPEWNLTADQITEDELITLATRYHATNLPAAPDEAITVVRTVTVEVGREGLPAKDERPYNPPSAAEELDIPIPDEYAAVSISYEGESYPLAGMWKDSSNSDVNGTRTGFVTVAVGGEAKVFWNGGYEEENGQLVFYATNGEKPDIGAVEELQFSNPPYGRALVPITSSRDLDPKPVTVGLDETAPVPNLLRVAVSALGVLSCTVTFSVRCRLTGNAKKAWQLSVYDALFSAWSQWKRDYESAQIRDTFLGGSEASDAGSSQRNEQIIREELKRQVIAWLLDEEDFKGRPALHPRPTKDQLETDFGDLDIQQALADAPTIQFLEQAFEWSNLAWVFYPYYWADRSKWGDLSQITANDPEFERFLRAGSSRVVLPTRPGFNNSVHNWLKCGTPFIDGQLPNPNHDLYISIDTEVREITSPVPDGIPGDYWQARLTTTLLYLEEEGDLPFVNEQHQLPAPPGVPYKPGPIIKVPVEVLPGDAEM